MCLLYVNEQDILFFYGSSDPHCVSWFGMSREVGLLQKVWDRQTVVFQWTFPHFTKKYTLVQIASSEVIQLDPALFWLLEIMTK